MNKVVLLSLSLAITGVIFFLIYLIPYFSKKKIRAGKFDVWQFIKLFFAPVLIIPIFYFFKQIIDENPYSPVLNFPEHFTQLTFLILIYFLILGNGIHAVAVVLSKHMKNLRKHKLWEINEFFHHSFSHFLMTASAALIFFSFAIYEINRPSLIPLTDMDVLILVISGIISGIIMGFAAIEGRIAYPMFFLMYLLSILLPIFFLRFDLNYKLFPLASFVEAMYLVGIFTISLYKYKKKGFPEIVPQNFFED